MPNLFCFHWALFLDYWWENKEIFKMGEEFLQILKKFKKTLASYGNTVYNNERCDYAMMQDVAARVGRELLRSMSDFKSGDKGKKSTFPRRCAWV